MQNISNFFTTPASESILAKYGPLVVGFVLTTILGGLFTRWVQRGNYSRQTKLELFRKRYDEGVSFLDQLSSLLDKRYFALQRLLWAILEGKSQEKIDLREKEYFEVVVQWNNLLRSNRNKIRLLIGQKEADDFLDYSDDGRQENPKSIHYQFAKAHNAVTHPKPGTTAESAQAVVNELNYSISNFLEGVTSEFARRASSLEILLEPSSSGTRSPRSGA